MAFAAVNGLDMYYEIHGDADGSPERWSWAAESLERLRAARASTTER
jgi:hypothetical protein